MDENESSSSESNEETDEKLDNEYNPEGDLPDRDSSHHALVEQIEESETLRRSDRKGKPPLMIL